MRAGALSNWAALAAVAGCGDGRDPVAPNAPEAAVTAAATSFAQIAAGNVHSCGVGASGVGYCWGLNSAGNLGDRTFQQPTCALDAIGTAWCWGTNQPRLVPTKVAAPQESTRSP